MRKIVAILLLITSLLVLAGCMGKPKAEVSIDYGNSTLYSREDMDAAIAEIRKEFDTWEGCELHSISYGSDDACSAENIKWMNELEAANDAQGCLTQGVTAKYVLRLPLDLFRLKSIMQLDEANYFCLSSMITTSFTLSAAFIFWHKVSYN